MTIFIPSRRALVLLRDAAKSPVEVVARAPRHNCLDRTVIRCDRRGGRHQVRTLECLVHAGLLAASGGVFVPTELGMRAAAALT